MEIIIEGNKLSFLQHQNVEFETFKLVKYGNSTVVFIGNKPFEFDTNIFHELCNKITGIQPSSIPFKLFELNVLKNKDQVTDFSKKSFTELNLFKSLFLIYNWVTIAFTDSYAIDLRSKVYNEFIVDITQNVGRQEDIYFLKHEVISRSENVMLLKHLQNMNLLAKAIFKDKALGTLETYFIPLDKPGMPRSEFSHIDDPTGEKTYSLWKNILFDRDTRISYWLNFRF